MISLGEADILPVRYQHLRSSPHHAATSHPSPSTTLCKQHHIIQSIHQLRLPPRLAYQDVHVALLLVPERKSEARKVPRVQLLGVARALFNVHLQTSVQVSIDLCVVVIIVEEPREA